MRRSLLFLPGNSPVMLQNAAVFPADSLIFDLEDAVAPDEKDAARILVASALKSIKYRQETVVRINPLDSIYWQEDLKAVIPCAPFAILLPKASSITSVELIDQELGRLEFEFGLERGQIKLILLIESALGLELSFELSLASKRIVGLMLGAEDLTADLGCARSKVGAEIFYSRSRLVIAARAAGIDAIDTPFTDVYDDEAFTADVKTALNLGFSAKAAISPRHLQQINELFSPSAEDIAYAQRVISALAEAESRGKGAVALDGKMIDAPIAGRAEKLLANARLLNLLEDKKLHEE